MPVCSPVRDAKVPRTDVATFFFRNAQAHLDQLVASGIAEEPRILVDGVTDESLTFTEIRRMSESIADALVARGFSLDANGTDGTLSQVVVVYSPSSIRFCPIHYGTLIAGGIYALVNTAQAAAAAVAKELEAVNASTVFVAPELLPELREVLKLTSLDIPDSRIILTRGSRDGFASIDALGAVPDWSMLERLAQPGVDISGHPALIARTSGTTGPAKFAVSAHCTLVSTFTVAKAFSKCAWMFDTTRCAPRQSRQIRVLSDRALCYVWGHGTLCYKPLLSSDMMVQMPPAGLEQYLGAIEKYRIDNIYASPGHFRRIMSGTTKLGPGRFASRADPARGFDLSSLKTAMTCFALLGPNRTRQYSEYFDGMRISTGFAQAETNIIAGNGADLKLPEGHLALCPGVVAKTVDEDGNETDGVGELCILTPQSALRYASGAPLPTTEDGFVRTGDCFQLTVCGFARPRGRVCEAIHTAAGVVVWPMDIEDEFAARGEVDDVAVFGSGARGHARAVALVALKSSAGATSQLAAIEKWLKAQTGVDVECRHVEAIPRTHGGGVKWAELGY
ncbi:hypothetical protein H4R18_003583 [Coemansia javaensis]|uniref:AMP-dependent synthetase/ligase domain-containing protein n=1 Tax=Coemansia javaensis TaxID=2761396 RepID=A0A9W8LI61_9FUNG|nr:hypothetical protein H4R18_003583 [Coemansia javaensis]